MPEIGKNKTADIIPEAVPFFHDPAKRSILFQLGAMLILGLLGYYLISNTIANLERQAIATGLGFLEKESSFEIGESLISYSAADTYARALLVGVINTLIVSFIGIILTVILGTFVGVARLSTNWLVSRIAAVYIEIFQDIPVLLQLFFWYALFYELLPSPKEAFNPVAGMFLSNRGLIFAIPEAHPAHKYIAVAFLSGCVLVYLLRRWARKRQETTGQVFPIFRVSVGILLGFPMITWWLAGAPTAMDVPILAGFNFKGGINISPEFTALLLGLVLYTAAFVAEVVRAGIQSSRNHHQPDRTGH
jgi:general L-amino acid transport system permease protein